MKQRVWIFCTLFLTIAFLAPLSQMNAYGASQEVPLEVQHLHAKARGDVNAHLRVYDPKTHAPRNYIVRHRRACDVLYSGSLHDNILRLAKVHGWPTVVWNVTHDYRWLGKTRILARKLPNILQLVLADYPLQAVFYRGNHILVINPRTLK